MSPTFRRRANAADGEDDDVEMARAFLESRHRIKSGTAAKAGADAGRAAAGGRRLKPQPPRGRPPPGGHRRASASGPSGAAPVRRRSQS